MDNTSGKNSREDVSLIVWRKRIISWSGTKSQRAQPSENKYSWFVFVLIVNIQLNFITVLYCCYAVYGTCDQVHDIEELVITNRSSALNVLVNSVSGGSCVTLSKILPKMTSFVNLNPHYN